MDRKGLHRAVEIMSKFENGTTWGNFLKLEMDDLSRRLKMGETVEKTGSKFQISKNIYIWADEEGENLISLFRPVKSGILEINGNIEKNPRLKK